MRVLIVSRPSHPAPPEMLLPLMDAFAAWRQRYKPMMESFFFFASGGGGCGVVNAPDEMTLAQMMAEFPWAPFSANTLDLIVDGDEMMGRVRETFQQMLAGQAGGGNGQQTATR